MNPGIELMNECMIYVWVSFFIEFEASRWDIKVPPSFSDFQILYFILLLRRKEALLIARVYSGFSYEHSIPGPKFVGVVIIIPSCSATSTTYPSSASASSTTSSTESISGARTVTWAFICETLP